MSVVFAGCGEAFYDQRYQSCCNGDILDTWTETDECLDGKIVRIQRHGNWTWYQRLKNIGAWYVWWTHTCSLNACLSLDTSICLLCEIASHQCRWLFTKQSAQLAIHRARLVEMQLTFRKLMFVYILLSHVICLSIWSRWHYFIYAFRNKWHATNCLVQLHIFTLHQILSRHSCVTAWMLD